MGPRGRREFARVLAEEDGIGGQTASAKGVSLAVISAVLFAVHGLIVRRSTENGFSTLQLSFWVGVVRWALSAIVVPWSPRLRDGALCAGHGWGLRGLVVLRQVVGSAALFSIYCAFARLPIGDATALVYTAPIFTTVLAHMWLGESITKVKLIAALLAFLGVSVIAHGTATTGEDARSRRESFLGTVFALTGALLLAGVMVVTRKIGKRVPAVVSIMYYGVFLTALSLGVSICLSSPLAPQAPVTARAWLEMLCGAVFSYYAQVLVTTSLQLCPASQVNVLGSLEIVFSFGLQVAFLHLVPGLGSLAGAATVLGCAVLVSLDSFKPTAISSSSLELQAATPPTRFVGGSTLKASAALSLAAVPAVEDDDC